MQSFCSDSVSAAKKKPANNSALTVNFLLRSRAKQVSTRRKVGAARAAPLIRDVTSPSETLPSSYYDPYFLLKHISFYLKFELKRERRKVITPSSSPFNNFLKRKSNRKKNSEISGGALFSVLFRSVPFRAIIKGIKGGRQQ